MSDPNWSDVVLLLTCDGTNGSTSFPDLSVQNNTMTAGLGGTPATPFVSTTTPRFGSGCITFNAGGTGTGGAGRGVLSTPINTGGPLDLTSVPSWTIEGWIYIPSTGNTGFAQVVFTYGSGPVTNGGTANGVTLEMDGSGHLSADFYGTASISIPAATYTADAWNHFAIVNNAGGVLFYLNGVATAAAQPLSGVAQYAGYLTLGGSYNFTVGLFQNLYRNQLDEIRVTNGVARYTSNFTPPVVPFDTSGAIIVPNVLGDTSAAAAAAIIAATLTVGTVTTEVNPFVAIGLVSSQNPVGGSSASAGAPVNYALSDGMGPPPGTAGIQAKFVSPAIGKAIMVANPGQINPRIYPPFEDNTVRAKP